MEFSVQNIRTIAATQPPVVAIDAITKLREKALGHRDAAQTFIDSADTILARLSILTDPVVPGTERAAEAKTSDPLLNEDDVILDALRLGGQMTLRQVIEATAAAGWHATYHTIYMRVLKAPDSLCNRGIVLFDASRKPGLAQINPEYKKPEIYFQEYLDRLNMLDVAKMRDKALPPDHPIMVRLAEAISVYTHEGIRKANHGKRVHAQRTWGAIGNRGVIGAIEVMVTGQPTPGFDMLAKLGRRDLLAEQIVVDHSEDFSDKAVASAKRRLESLKKDGGDV